MTAQTPGGAGQGPGAGAPAVAPGPAAAAAAAGQVKLSTGTYEFTDDENLRIERAATSSRIWAACAVVGALLLATLAGLQFYLNNLRGAILVLPLFLICAVAGWLYFDAGRALKDVVDTEGNDVELLMRALERMARAFRYEVIVTAVAVVIFVGLALASRI